MTTQTSAAKSRARRFALQALYQMQFSDCSVYEVEKQFLQDYDMKRVDKEYLHDLLIGVDKHRDELTEAFSTKLDRRNEELDPISRAALLIGTYEIVHRIEIPFKVAINESVELAKQFGAAESHKYVNSVLDSLAAEYRSVERQSGKR